MHVKILAWWRRVLHIATQSADGWSIVMRVTKICSVLTVWKAKLLLLVWALKQKHTLRISPYLLYATLGCHRNASVARCRAQPLSVCLRNTVLNAGEKYLCHVYSALIFIKLVCLNLLFFNMYVVQPPLMAPLGNERKYT